MYLPLFFVAVYLIVDIAYVSISKGYYSAVAARISHDPRGFPEMNATRAAGAVISYAAMVAAWLFFVPVAVAHYRRVFAVSGPASAAAVGALVGFVFGVLVYGVFNGTLHVMFKEYDLAVVLRDFAWGTGWATALTAAYAAATVAWVR